MGEPPNSEGLDGSVIKRFARFVLVGAVGTGAHYTVLMILVELGHLAPTVASGAGFVVGGVVNYRLNHGFTFASTLPHHKAAPRFIVTATVGLLLNLGIMAALTQGLGTHYLAAQVVATGGALIWNFLLSHYWSFSSRRV